MHLLSYVDPMVFAVSDNSTTTTTLTSSERWQQRQRQNGKVPCHFWKASWRLRGTTRGIPQEVPWNQISQCRAKRCLLQFVEMMSFTCCTFWLPLVGELALYMLCLSFFAHWYLLIRVIFLSILLCVHSPLRIQFTKVCQEWWQGAGTREWTWPWRSM